MNKQKTIHQNLKYINPRKLFLEKNIILVKQVKKINSFLENNKKKLLT